MYIIIDGVKYARLAALTFAPETDLTGDGLPINQFQADIITSDNIRIGRYARLYDDRDRLWAKYWITFAEQVDRNTMRVVADSDIRLLDREKLPAVMWESASVRDIVADLFQAAGGGDPVYTIDDTFQNAIVEGYCPEQTPRERLQQVLVSIGAYVRSYASETIEIRPLPETEALIPMNRTFWKPTLDYKDWVTSLVYREYWYELGEPGSSDDYVKVGEDTYIQTWIDLEYFNSYAPPEAPKNTVRLEDLTLFCGYTANLTAYWFAHAGVELDVINNGEYWPGDRVIVYTDENALAVGHIEKCDFKFGLQARSKLRLSMTESRAAAVLTINYLDENMRRIGRRTVTLPAGYPYTIGNPFIDYTEGDVRIIYRPLELSISGYMPDEDDRVDVPCVPALVHVNNILEIVSVDTVRQDEEGVVIIE